MKMTKRRLNLRMFTPLAIKLIEMAVENANKGNYTYVGVCHFDKAIKELKIKHDSLNEP